MPATHEEAEVGAALRLGEAGGDEPGLRELLPERAIEARPARQLERAQLLRRALVGEDLAREIDRGLLLVAVGEIHLALLAGTELRFSDCQIRPSRRI